MLRVCVSSIWTFLMSFVSWYVCVYVYICLIYIYVSLEMSIPTASKKFFFSDELVVLTVSRMIFPPYDLTLLPTSQRAVCGTRLKSTRRHAERFRFS